MPNQCHKCGNTDTRKEWHDARRTIMGTGIRQVNKGVNKNRDDNEKNTGRNFHENRTDKFPVCQNQ